MEFYESVQDQRFNQRATSDVENKLTIKAESDRENRIIHTALWNVANAAMAGQTEPLPKEERAIIQNIVSNGPVRVSLTAEQAKSLSELLCRGDDSIPDPTSSDPTASTIAKTINDELTVRAANFDTLSPEDFGAMPEQTGQ